VSFRGTRRYDGRDRLERFGIPQEDPRRGLGAVHVAVPVHHAPFSEELGVGSELAPQVLPELDIVPEVRLRLDPGQLLTVMQDRLVEERVRRLCVLPPQVLLGPVSDPVLLEPGRQAVLALPAALALEFHALGRVDPVRRQEFLDLPPDALVRRRLRMEEGLPHPLARDPELAEHLLTHQHRREVPLLRDVPDRTAAFPLGDEAGDLPTDHVEPPGRVPRDPMRVDHEEELGVEVFRAGEAFDIVVGD